MKTAFCVVSLMCLVTSDLDECARDYSKTGGGHFAIYGVNEEIKAPWLAAIGISRGKYTFQVFCSGSIITRRFILTAVHCFINPDNRYQPSHVRAGANNIESYYIEQREILDVKKHPGYDGDSKAYYFDVAIIVVEELKFSSRISPICLPGAASLHPGNGLSISVQGWGVTDNGQGKDVSEVNVGIRSKVKRAFNCEKIYQKRF